MKTLRYTVSYDSDLRADARIGIDQFLELYESFPWEEEWVRTKESEDEYPYISLYHSDNHYLEIAREENNRVRFFYRNQNQYNDWYFEVDPGNAKSYEKMLKLVEDFYSKKLPLSHDILVSPDVEHFKPILSAWYIVFTLSLITFISLFLALIINYQDKLDSFSLWAILIFNSLLGLTFLSPSFLVFAYYLNDKRHQIRLDWKNKTMFISNGKETEVIAFAEIEHLDICRQPQQYRRIIELSYLRIQTATKCYYVSSLSADTKTLASRFGKKPREKVFIYPYLRCAIPTKRELAALRRREDRFYVRFQKKETEFLKQIINSPNTHSDIAVSAAKRVLQDRSEH